MWLFAALLVAPLAPDPKAVAIIDTSIERMGGATALRGLTRVRLEMMTQWQRTSFDPRPYTDLPSYERHTEQRNYSLPAWRNYRRFAAGSSWREITDVVRDSVAIRQSNGAWAPLNVAYVDERRELFTFAAERLLLEAREAADLRTLADTTIGGVAHARMAATVNGFSSTLFFRRTDGLLAMARYGAAQPNDFGLAPWGKMEVEVWYSRWTAGPNGTSLPWQWDVKRVGRPYKRMTVLSFTVDTAVADSFAVTDSLRTAFFATANHPMQDVPLDSARLIQPSLVRFASFGYPAGAVKVGKSWLLLETGQSEINAERALEWLGRNDAEGKVSGAVVTLPAGANGGVVYLSQKQMPLYVGPGASPFVATILRNHGRTLPKAAQVDRGQWVRVTGDSVWVEPIDLPDAPASLLLYVPSLKWVYASVATAPMHQRYVMDKLRSHGWTAEKIGSLRDLWAQAPVPQSQSS
jgi:hypothetical protein